MTGDYIPRKAALAAVSIGANRYDMAELIQRVPACFKWIPASEPPDEWGDFLCWYEYYNWQKEEMTQSFGLGYWNAYDKCWGGEARQGKDARVIAYMPLPEPPEGAAI